MITSHVNDMLLTCYKSPRYLPVMNGRMETMKIWLNTQFVILMLAFATATQPVAAQASPAPELAHSVQHYAEAWGSRNAERIAALHSEDSVFRLFVDGAEAANGRAAILGQFRQILVNNPGYRSTVRSVLFGNDHVVIEYDINMDPPRPFIFGNTRYVPNNRAYLVPAIDIIHFRGGLVTIKHTYLDAAVIRANSRRATRAGR